MTLPFAGLLLIIHIPSFFPYRSLLMDGLLLAWGIISGWVWLTMDNPRLAWSRADICLFLLVLYATFNSIWLSHLQNSYLGFWVWIWVIYVLVRVTTAYAPEYNRRIWLCLLGMGLFQMGIALLQLFNVLPNLQSAFALGGTLGNPGALGGYLSTLLPAAFAFWFLHDSVTTPSLRYVGGTFMATALCVLPATMARGAWVAGFVSIGWLLQQRYNGWQVFSSWFRHTTQRWVKVGLAGGLMAVLLIALFYFKAPSAWGRLFIWQTTLRAWADALWWGVGAGHFDSVYNSYQARFFALHSPLHPNALVADYVASAYNEYLELGLQLGVVGLVLLLIFLFFTWYDAKGNERFSTERWAEMSCLIAVLVLALTSYPWKTEPTALNLAIMLGLLGGKKPLYVIKPSRWAFRFAGLAAVGILACIGVMRWHYHQARESYRLALGYTMNGSFSQAITLYQRSLSSLGQDGEFLFYYASALTRAQSHTSGIAVMHQAQQWRGDPNLFILMGSVYESTHQFRAAEWAYTRAANGVPSRFYPRYCLLKLYQQTHQREKMVAIAQLLLQIPEKIPSQAVQEMKDEAKAILYPMSKRVKK